jgi:hypothetical protein
LIVFASLIELGQGCWSDVAGEARNMNNTNASEPSHTNFLVNTTILSYLTQSGILHTNVQAFSAHFPSRIHLPSTHHNRPPWRSAARKHAAKRKRVVQLLPLGSSLHRTKTAAGALSRHSFVASGYLSRSRHSSLPSLASVGFSAHVLRHSGQSLPSVWHACSRFTSPQPTASILATVFLCFMQTWTSDCVVRKLILHDFAICLSTHSICIVPIVFAPNNLLARNVQSVRQCSKSAHDEQTTKILTNTTLCRSD